MLFALLADGRWHFGVGDPTFIGWFTFAAYFAAAWLCFAAFRRSRGLARTGSGRVAELERTMSWLWALCTLAMLVLGANKQLDLQTLFLQVAKGISQRQGWYEQRHRYQVLFILGLGMAGCCSAALLGYLLRRVLFRARGALLGLGLVFGFVLLRAAFMEHVGTAFGGLLGNRLAWLVELSGIAVLGWSAYHAERAGSA
jgi:hypothetical protein